MRVAFYAPLKSPDHPVPSGDRRMARLLMSALAIGGYQVEVASELRSLDRRGDKALQDDIRARAAGEADRLIAAYRRRPVARRPALWFTYHVYYKAPDWLGPVVSSSLGIPYATAEASFAPKRAAGPWATGHEQTRAALHAGDVHFCLTAFDRVALEHELGGRDRLVDLPPFLESVPVMDEEGRFRRRATVCNSAGFDASAPVIITVAMMRPGDKEASFAMLAGALAGLLHLDWSLIIVGDGEARGRIEEAFAAIPRGRVHWVGAVEPDAVGRWLAAADVYAWPAHNEAYGMAFLEAQAWGLPVVAQATRGVPDVVAAGRSGLLTPEGDTEAFRQAIARLLVDPERRAMLGAAAREFVTQERTIERASAILDRGLQRALGS